MIFTLNPAFTASLTPFLAELPCMWNEPQPSLGMWWLEFSNACVSSMSSELSVRMPSLVASVSTDCLSPVETSAIGHFSSIAERLLGRVSKLNDPRG